MLLLIAFIFLLGSITFFIIALVCKIMDNGKALKNLIRAVLFLILFVVTMAFDDPPEAKSDHLGENMVMEIEG